VRYSAGGFVFDPSGSQETFMASYEHEIIARCAGFRGCCFHRVFCNQIGNVAAA
jgi:hypothetical protein